MNIGKIKKKILCDILGWHNGNELMYSIQLAYFGQINATCSRCGKKVMLDSQGNWF